MIDDGDVWIFFCPSNSDILCLGMFGRGLEEEDCLICSSRICSDHLFYKKDLRLCSCCLGRSLKIDSGDDGDDDDDDFPSSQTSAPFYQMLLLRLKKMRMLLLQLS